MNYPELLTQRPFQGGLMPGGSDVNPYAKALQEMLQSFARFRAFREAGPGGAQGGLRQIPGSGPEMFDRLFQGPQNGSGGTLWDRGRLPGRGY